LPGWVSLKATIAQGASRPMPRRTPSIHTIDRICLGQTPRNGLQHSALEAWDARQAQCVALRFPKCCRRDSLHGPRGNCHGCSWPQGRSAPDTIVLVSAIQENLLRVEEQIAAACRRASRERGEVRLMAVSKVHPAEALAEALAAGVTLFGENRVQEYEAKRSRLRELGAGDAEVHLIGHLQSNKSAKAAEMFAGIDSVDSLRLAERLHEAAGGLGRRLPILLELKLSDEPTKAGLLPESPELAALLERLPDLTQLAVRGLMTIAPFDENPETARACFRRLRALRDELAQAHPKLDLGELSMGMSGDFAIAIEEGSTLVRIGTALFGARPRQG
jgi:PLP dependent protein